MIYPYTSIRAVHLEITDRCNAACPMCPRFVDGEEAPYIQNTHMSLSDVKDIFPVQFIQQLNRINFCGNYGDPIVARDLLNVINYFKDVGRLGHPLRIEVNTNGSARPEMWWKVLAKLIGPNEIDGGVWFGLDGLEDTNHLYRRNTNWDLIMRNVKAYIGAGGVAHWNFIVFKHNEHQVDEARALAKEMGFKHFNVKLTGRFKTSQSFPVIVKGDHLYDLEPAKEEQYKRPPASNNRTIHIETGTEQAGDTVIQNAPNIKCMVQDEASIYVSAQGLVYPCCWIANAHSQSDPQIIMNCGNIDPTERSIKDIVNGAEFQMIEDSWNTGSIRTCVNMCGVTTPNEKSKYGSDYVIHRRVDGTD